VANDFTASASATRHRNAGESIAGVGDTGGRFTRLPGSNELKIEILQKGQIIETREFAEGSHKIGRASGCDILLRSPQVSKQHALLVIKGEKAAIVDLGSSNGLFVNAVLVRKQRIEPGDEVTIGDYALRIARPERKSPGRPASVAPNFSGNAAPNLNYATPANEEAMPEITPQERLLLLMDQHVLSPFYSIMKSFDWRGLLATILLSTLVLSVVLSVIPIVRWGKGITTKEALARAHTVIGQTVRENYRILAKTNDYTRLTVEAAEAEQGMLSVFIVDPKNNSVLAPTKSFNTSVTDVYTLIAIKKIIEAKEEVVSVPKEADGVYVVAQPIYLFSAETNDRSLIAVVIGNFQIPSAVNSTFEPMVEAALFSVLLSLAAYYLIFKMFSYPIIQMHEQLDSALKGDEVTVTSAAKFPELETLATVINFSISRWKQGGNAGAGNAGGGGGDSGEDDQNAYSLAVQEFDSATTDGLLLLDKDKKVIFVGHVLEELLSLRNQYAQGQNITEACRDGSFAGTVVDLCENVVSSLGVAQSANLDINGTARTIMAQGHRSRGGQIETLLITVKMNNV
jgi:hypothetical protein